MRINKIGPNGLECLVMIIGLSCVSLLAWSSSVQFYIGDLVELRPDDGEQVEVLVRLPLAGNADFEEVRELQSDLRDEERSGCLVKDIRSSVFANLWAR
jgi:hypothetical protein